MHVRVRSFATSDGGGGEAVVPLPSRLSTVEELRRLVAAEFGVPESNQRLLYGGKLLENGRTLHDYNVKLNDVVQLTRRDDDAERAKEPPEEADGADPEGSDATSELYEIGDLVDAKDEIGAWYEGRIVRITTDPRGRSDRPNRSGPSVESNDEETRLVFGVAREGEERISNYKPSDVRPRARRELNRKDLKPGDAVMVNYNPDDPNSEGFWFDFKVEKISKRRTRTELNGTINYGTEAFALNATVKRQDKIFAIEKPIPLKMRTEEISRLMKTDTEPRSLAPNCDACEDDDNVKCKHCGCVVCESKNDPDKIVLCDECDDGHHLSCLDPPLLHLPEDDWYCPKCRRDVDEIVAPGKRTQPRKKEESKKDWGRGMACMGRSQSSKLPSDHFGPVPGIEVGMTWKFRIQLSELGVHRPPVSGIHGKDAIGAFSIVLSGGYEDDVDNGFEFTYTGSGGRDLSGNRRTADQSSDQVLTRENRALARNCAVEEINQNGADAGDNWKNGKPVRVVRSYKLAKYCPKYAPSEGIRYDGIYKVVKYYPEKGKAGFVVWKYLLKRDDPSPAPWENGARKYPVIYPDGYLEAEAAKRALKDKSKVKEKNNNTKVVKRKKKSPDDSLPSAKRTRLTRSMTSKTPLKPHNEKSPLKAQSWANSKENRGLLQSEMDLISVDVLNKNIWDEFITLIERDGRQNLIAKVSNLFLCIICQDVVARPITTDCGHNFCTGCINLSFTSTKSKKCPHCRTDLAKDDLKPNNSLKEALRFLIPGYDKGRK